MNNNIKSSLAQKYNLYPAISANNTNETDEDIWVTVDTMDVYMGPYDDDIFGNGGKRDALYELFEGWSWWDFIYDIWMIYGRKTNNAMNTIALIQREWQCQHLRHVFMYILFVYITELNCLYSLVVYGWSEHWLMIIW